jgi:hypothetical protein
LQRLFSARYEYANEWYRFLHPNAGADSVMILDWGTERFPFQSWGTMLAINEVHVFTRLKDRVASVQPLQVYLSQAQTPPAVATLDETTDGLLLAPIDPGNPSPQWLTQSHAYPGALTGAWQFTVHATDIAPLIDQIDDILFICSYSIG